MIWLMMKAAMKPPIMLPSPPSTQIMKMSGPNVLPMKGCTSYCSASRQAREPGERAADRRGHEIDAPLVDAHQAHDLAVLRDGADRGADIGALEEEIERDRADQRDAEGEQAREADDRSSPISMIGSRTPMLRNSVPNSSVAKLCRKNSRPPVASSWLIGAESEHRRDDQEMHAARRAPRRRRSRSGRQAAAAQP